MEAEQEALDPKCIHCDCYSCEARCATVEGNGCGGRRICPWDTPPCRSRHCSAVLQGEFDDMRVERAMEEGGCIRD